MQKRSVHILGGIAAFGYMLATILSYWLAPTEIVLDHQKPTSLRFYTDLTGIAPLNLTSHSWVTFFALYMAPLLLPTIVAGLAILILQRSKTTEEVPRLVYIWAIAFALIAVPSLPVAEQDFWSGAGWGKMSVEGLNPYYFDMPAHIASAWYPDDFLVRMTYGPLWAAICTVVMALSPVPWVAFVLFKGVLLSAWIGALWLVRKLTAGLPANQQAIALFIVGWLPEGVGQSVAEGHNDIVMVALLLLWLFTRRPIVLMAGICFKYALAPLALFDFIEQPRIGKWIPATLFALASFALFFRGPDMLLNTTHLLNWTPVLSPRVAVSILGPVAEDMVSLAIASLVGLVIWRWWQNRTPETRLRAIVAMLAGLVFGVMTCMWPWYLTWVLLPAALLPSWHLTRFVTGVALVSPFSVLFLLGHPLDWLHGLPVLAMYLFAAGWLGLTILIDKWTPVQNRVNLVE